MEVIKHGAKLTEQHAFESAQGETWTQADPV